MDFQRNLGILSSLPPKLEDAGLEDCALPIEEIQSVIQDYKAFLARKCEEVRMQEEEAFRIAAEKAKAAADCLKINLNSKTKNDGGCTSDPGSAIGDLKDATIGPVGAEQGDSCVDTHTGGLLEEGKDAVVDPLGDSMEDKLVVGVDGVPKLGLDGCMKGGILEPVGIPDVSVGSDSADDNGDDEPKGPTLTEAFL